MRKFVMLLITISLLTLALAACGGGGGGGGDQPPVQAGAPAAAAGDVANGAKLFKSTCIACHGEGGVGVQGLGKNMTTSEFIAGLSDAELIDFIKKGRDPSDPLNTTGVAMPPKGGNPALTDENLVDIVAYVRTLHK